MIKIALLLLVACGDNAQPAVPIDAAPDAGPLTWREVDHEISAAWCAYEARCHEVDYAYYYGSDALCVEFNTLYFCVVEGATTCASAYPDSTTIQYSDLQACLVDQGGPCTSGWPYVCVQAIAGPV